MKLLDEKSDFSMPRRILPRKICRAPNYYVKYKCLLNIATSATFQTAAITAKISDFSFFLTIVAEKRVKAIGEGFGPILEVALICWA